MIGRHDNRPSGSLNRLRPRRKRLESPHPRSQHLRRTHMYPPCTPIPHSPPSPFSRLDFGGYLTWVDMFTLFYGVSWGPIAWTLPSEIFPTRLRAKGVALSTASNWVPHPRPHVLAPIKPSQAKPTVPPPRSLSLQCPLFALSDSLFSIVSDGNR